MTDITVGDMVEWDLPSHYGRYIDEAFVNLHGHGPFEISAVYTAENRTDRRGTLVEIVKKGAERGSSGLRGPLRAELFRKLNSK